MKTRKGSWNTRTDGTRGQSRPNLDHSLLLRPTCGQGPWAGWWGCACWAIKPAPRCKLSFCCFKNSFLLSLPRINACPRIDPESESDLLQILGGVDAWQLRAKHVTVNGVQYSE